MKRYGAPGESTIPPGRRNFSLNVDITGRGARAHENPTVHSKADRRGHDPRAASTDPRQPRTSADGVYRDPVNGDSPITHHNEPFRQHVETVGWHPHTGEYTHPTHPNAEAKAAGNAKHTHRPLEPVGQTHSKYGGEHGEPQKLPPGRGEGGATAPHGSLNRDPMANRHSRSSK